MLRCAFLENGSKRMTRRGARAADSACLESTCAGNGTVGSNPTLSASLRQGFGRQASVSEGWRASSEGKLSADG